MARIPINELDRLKSEVSVVRVVESSGIELKKHGKDYLGLCPFHDGKEPSLVIPVISPEGMITEVYGRKLLGMDANEYALQVTPAAKSLGVVLRSAEWMGKGKSPSISTGTASDEIIDTETGEILTVPDTSTEPESSNSLAAKETIPEPSTASPQPKPADDIKARSH